MKKMLVKSVSWLLILTMVLAMSGCISLAGRSSEEVQKTIDGFFLDVTSSRYFNSGFISDYAADDSFASLDIEDERILPLMQDGLRLLTYEIEEIQARKSAGYAECKVIIEMIDFEQIASGFEGQEYDEGAWLLAMFAVDAPTTQIEVVFELEYSKQTSEWMIIDSAQFAERFASPYLSVSLPIEEEEEEEEEVEEVEIEEAPIDINNDPMSGDLVVWSYSNELLVHAIAFQEAYPDVNVEYVFRPSESFAGDLIAAANTSLCPDVVMLEAAFLRDFVESDMLMDLSDLLPRAESVGAFQYTIDLGTDFDSGEVRAYTYQANHGAVFYRRSLAIDLFGTDDPEAIQALMQDMDKFTQMARDIQERSNGSIYIMGSFNALEIVFANNLLIQQNASDGLAVDLLAQKANYSNIFSSEGLVPNIGQWTPEWFDATTGSVPHPETGDQIQLFSYFFPSWGLQYVLLNNASSTSGDWAMVPGPMPYYWGGSWVGVMNNASNPDLASEFVAFVTMNEVHLENWATGVYSANYLNSIAQDYLLEFGYEAFQQDIFQLAGGFVNSSNVVEAIIPYFENSQMSRFLGGQNFYEAFYEVASRT